MNEYSNFYYCYIAQVWRWVDLGADGHPDERRNGRLLLAQRDQLLWSTTQSGQLHSTGQAALVVHDTHHHRQFADR